MSTPSSSKSRFSGVVADAVSGNFVDRLLPAWLKPYGRLARWDRPIGWWLLLWPCWWSAALAAVAADRAFPNPLHIVLFLIGAVAMRGAGCTYNDIVDREYDGRVARTASRPIPSGQVTVTLALVFLVLQALVGLAVLLSLNTFSIFLGIASLAIIACYPFMKRITDWPQLVLGLAFSWGALMGWAAAFGELSAAPVLLYGASIAWTIGYDTIYAHQDKEDDAIIGVRSTALLFGDRTRLGLAGFYGLACVLMFASFVIADAGPAAFIGLLGFAGHLAWQALTIDISDPDHCLKLFKSNKIAGWILFIGLLLDALIGA